MKTSLVWIGGLMFSTLAWATPGPEVRDILGCMQGNLVRHGALRQLEVVTTDPSGGTTYLALNMYWRSIKNVAKVVLHVSKPDDLAGSAYLLRETTGNADELYVYIPSIGKPRRISGSARSENLWGTTFSYEEIKLAQGLPLTGATRRAQDAAVGGRPAYTIETDYSGDELPFSKVLTYVDQESCTVLKAEMFDRENKLSKVLDGDLSRLVKSADAKGNPLWMLLGYTMRDLARGANSRIQFGEVTMLEKQSMDFFTPDNFFRPPGSP